MRDSRLDGVKIPQAQENGARGKIGRISEVQTSSASNAQAIKEAQGIEAQYVTGEEAGEAPKPERNRALCIRCNRWKAHYQVLRGNEYEASCVSCLTPNERQAIDAAEQRTGVEESTVYD